MSLLRMTLPNMLRAIADEIESGARPVAVEAVLITRSMEDDGLAIDPWGEHTGCVSQAAGLIDRIERTD